RVLPVVLVTKPARWNPEYHFPAWAVAEREAFLPGLFSESDQHTLSIDGRRQREWPCPWPPGAVYTFSEAELVRAYDFGWLDNPAGALSKCRPSWKKCLRRRR